MQFVGTAEYALDRKRVPVPPAYRNAFKAGGYVTTGTGPYLVLHTIESFDAAAQVVEALPPETEEGEEVRRDFYGNAEAVAPDAQGRVQLSDKHIDHAGLERDVVVVGVGRRLEIWDRGAYRSRDESRQKTRRTLIAERPAASPAAGG